MNASVMIAGVVPRAPVSETLDSKTAARKLGGDLSIHQFEDRGLTA